MQELHEILSSFLQRKVATLAAILESPGRIPNIYVARELSIDILELTRALTALRYEPGDGASSSSTELAELQEQVLHHLSLNNEANREMLRRVVSDDFSANLNLKQSIRDIQERLDETPSGLGRLASACLNVGVLTLATAGVAAPLAALAIGDPVGKKVLEAAIATFIAATLVEVAETTRGVVEIRLDEPWPEQEEPQAEPTLDDLLQRYQLTTEGERDDLDSEDRDDRDR